MKRRVLTTEMTGKGKSRLARSKISLYPAFAAIVEVGAVSTPAWNFPCCIPAKTSGDPPAVMTPTSRLAVQPNCLRNASAAK
jgi:hypothetical protein